MKETPEMDDEICAFVEKEKQELAGDFCGAAATVCRVRRAS